MATFPFWSPDSRSIAFFATGRLKRLDLDAGSALDAVRGPRRPRRLVESEGRDPVLTRRARRTAAGLGRGRRAVARDVDRRHDVHQPPLAADSSRRTPLRLSRRPAGGRPRPERGLPRLARRARAADAAALAEPGGLRQRAPAVPARPDVLGAAVRSRERDAERRAGGHCARRDGGSDDLARHLRRQRVRRARLSERPAGHAAHDVRPAGPRGRDDR